ncbi:hypothetical protein IWW38_003219 [Coemansia aciculifera]|uniref:Uncharacterized protein n=1 Tax=Coemansia aciculifera TaxID=417176 RepID=A0ACC1M1R7_9FUNG|nr:hypothetical protein IWW38_003219 [Coemansia aciculifera]
MASLSTSASSSVTLSGDSSPELNSAVTATQQQKLQGGSIFSGESRSPSESDIMDYEDFMYLSACENHRHRFLRSTAPESGASGHLLVATDRSKWWPRCVMPVQNMQYMPKLSLMFAGELSSGTNNVMSDRHHSSESIPLQWLQPDSPRLLRARSEGAIGSKVATTGNGRRVDFWDVLGRCPMRPTSSLALASLKDMAKSCADACGYVDSNRKSDSENQRVGDYMANNSNGLADSASDTDDSDSDSESTTPAYGMLLGLSAKQSTSATAQRSNNINSNSVQQQRNRSKSKRVLSEPMQYILYNSYLRYYGRPGEAQ